MRRSLAAALIVLLGLAQAAEALTIRDIIELSRAGLGDDVLLALIDVDAGVFANDRETIKALKDAGVSERVIVALIRSGRQRQLPEPAPVVAPDPEPAPAPAPQIVVIDHHDAQPQQVVVPVPVFFPVVTTGGFRRGQVLRAAPATGEPFIPFQSGPPVARPVVQEPKEPVYWGFGGKRRPDTWTLPPEQRQPDRQKDNKR
jgi:hypothetical protein